MVTTQHKSVWRAEGKFRDVEPFLDAHHPLKSWLAKGKSTTAQGDEKKTGSDKNSRERRFNVDEGRRDLV